VNTICLAIKTSNVEKPVPINLTQVGEMSRVQIPISPLKSRILAVCARVLLYEFFAECSFLQILKCSEVLKNIIITEITWSEEI
jgi:hypothetical protein